MGRGDRRGLQDAAVMMMRRAQWFLMSLPMLVVWGAGWKNRRTRVQRELDVASSRAVWPLRCEGQRARLVGVGLEGPRVLSS
jgi:hypothetical protein